MNGVTFQLECPGIRGASTLARALNGLKTKGVIHDWHPGRWKNGRAQTRIEIVFDSQGDAEAARSSVLN